MFRIPSFYQMPEMTWDEAVNIINRLNIKGDLLSGMQYMDNVWAEYIASEDQDDDEFFDNWIYEVNAFNVVFEGMSKLFAPKEKEA